MIYYLETGILDENALFPTSRRYFGLNSRRGVACGDYVCVLKGCDSLVSLRENGDHFLYVGDNIVQDMMNGQAAKLLEEGLAELRQFELR